MNRFAAALSLLMLVGWQSAQAQPISAGISDPALAACIEKLVSKNGWSRASDVAEIKCHNKGIASVSGIAKFKNVSKVSLYKNEIERFDASVFPELVHLNVAGNKLTTLNVQDAPHLEVLYAFHNTLDRLTVKGCPVLVSLKANNNQLTHASLTDVAALSKVYLFDNELESLAVDGLTQLSYLDVRHNPMPDDFYDFLDTIAGLTALHDGNAEDWD